MHGACWHNALFRKKKIQDWITAAMEMICLIGWDKNYFFSFIYNSELWTITIYYFLGHSYMSRETATVAGSKPAFNIIIIISLGRPQTMGTSGSIRKLMWQWFPGEGRGGGVFDRSGKPLVKFTVEFDRRGDTAERKGGFVCEREKWSAAKTLNSQPFVSFAEL